MWFLGCGDGTIVKRSTWIVFLVAIIALIVSTTSTVAGEQIDDVDENGGMMTEYPDAPISESKMALGVEILDGNGVFLSPDHRRLIITSLGGVIVFDPVTMEEISMYAFSTVHGGGVRCYGGVHFSMHSSIKYLTFMVVESPGTPNAVTRVIGLDLEDGRELFVSDDLIGEGAGTPIASYDGTMIALTHNENGMIGYFTVLFVEMYANTSTLNVRVAKTTSNAVADDDTNEVQVQQIIDDLYVLPSSPFSPVGYYHNPVRGMYNGGETNDNDVFVWCNDIRSDRNNVTAGDGAIYVWQGAEGLSPEDEGYYEYTIVDDSENWISSNPPTIGDDGKSLYWTVSKGDNFAWVEDQGWFRPETSRLGIGERGEPRYIAGRAQPTLSHPMPPPFDEEQQPNVYGVGASNLIWKTDHALTEDSLMVQATTDVVHARIHITPDNLRLLYVTRDGNVICADAMNLNDVWMETIEEGNLLGEIAYDPTRGVLYVPSTSGFLYSYQIANVPTPAPMQSPSTIPTVQPTNMPTNIQSDSPTLRSSNTPSIGPTTEPVTNVPTTMTESTFVPTTDPMAVSETTTEQPVKDDTDPVTLATFVPTAKSSAMTTTTRTTIAFGIAVFVVVMTMGGF